MKNLIYSIGLCILILGCTKEVGKKEYELIFTFSTSERCIINSFVFEKTKKYKNQDANYYVGKPHVGNQIYIEGKLYNGANFPLILFKTEAKFLAGINAVSIPLNSASFAGNQNIQVTGILDMYGKYEKKGRKFIVENGTFTIDWTNAADYGQSNQQLTGTWTLKRK